MNADDNAKYFLALTCKWAAREWCRPARMRPGEVRTLAWEVLCVLLPVAFPSLPLAFKFPLSRFISGASTAWLTLKRSCFLSLPLPSPSYFFPSFLSPPIKGAQLNLWPFWDPKYRAIYALYLCVHHLLSPANHLEGGDRLSLIFAIISVKCSHFDTLVFNNYSLPSFARAMEWLWKWGCQF